MELRQPGSLRPEAVAVRADDSAGATRHAGPSQPLRGDTEPASSCKRTWSASVPSSPLRSRSSAFARTVSQRMRSSRPSIELAAQADPGNLLGTAMMLYALTDASRSGIHECEKHVQRPAHTRLSRRDFIAALSVSTARWSAAGSHSTRSVFTCRSRRLSACFRPAVMRSISRI